MKMKRLLAVLLAAALLTAAFALPSVSAHETGASSAIGDIDYEENPTGHCTEEGPSIFLKSESNFADDYYLPVEKWSDQPSVSFVSPADLEIVSFDFSVKAEPEGEWVDVGFEDSNVFSPEIRLDKIDKQEILGSFKCAKTPCAIEKFDPFFESTLSGDGEGNILITFDVKNLIVRTDDGDKMPVRNSEVLDTPLNIKLGDANLDGVVNINDVTLVQRYLADYINQDGKPLIDVSDPLSLYVADVNDDGRISIKDVTAVQSYLADYFESFV